MRRSRRGQIRRTWRWVAHAVSVTALLAAAGCGRDAADARPTAAGAGADRGGGAAARRGSGGGGSGGPERARLLVLSPSDVATAALGTISETVPISGALNPLDEVTVRARIEGTVTGVFVREGEPVRSGELLARFEAVTQESQAASTRAAEAAARAELTTAEWNLAQTADLFRAGAVSEAELRAARQQADAARAKLAAAEAALRVASVTERDTRVVAPMGGVVATRTVQPGERVAPGAPLFTIVRNSTLELAATVPERQAGGVRTGQVVRFTADGRSFDGRVARVSPTVDPASRSITVYVEVPNPGNGLRGGSFATGGVVLRTVPDALLVPTAALRQGQEGSRIDVYRITRGRIERVDVTTGVVDERAGVAQITVGLTAGDRVVAGNVGTVTEGSPVQIIGGDRPAGARGP